MADQNVTDWIKGVPELAKQMALLNQELKETVDIISKGRSVFNERSKSQSDLAGKTKKLTEAEKSLAKAEKARIATEQLATKEGRAAIAARVRLAEATRSATSAERQAQGVTRKSGGLFKSVTKSILAAGAAMATLGAVFNILKKGFKTIKDFEKGMSEVRAITKATVKDFKALQQNALLLGSTTSKTALQVAGLQKEFAKLGFTTQEILAATDATIDLSIAAGVDLAEAAVVSASTIRGFGLSAQETQRVVDVMAESFSSSALDLAKFKTGMAIIAPVAKASGKSIEFATTQLAILSDAGVDASTAGTSLRNMFLELSKHGLTWEEGLEKIRTSTDKNITALKLFGKRGATAALILADNVDKAAKLEEQFINSAGAAEEMANVMEDNLAGEIERTKSAWEGFTLSLNQGNGVISKLARNVVKLWGEVAKGFKILAIGQEAFLDETLTNQFAEETKNDMAAVIKYYREVFGEAEILNKLREDEAIALSTVNELYQKGLEAGDKATKRAIQTDLLRNEVLLTNTQNAIKLIEEETEAREKAAKDAADAVITEEKRKADEQLKINKKISDKIISLSSTVLENKLLALDKEEEALREKGVSEVKIAEYVALQRKLIGEELAEDLNKIEEDRLNEQFKLEEKALEDDLDLLAKANDKKLDLFIDQAAEEGKLKADIAAEELKAAAEAEQLKQDTINNIKERALDAAGEIVSNKLTAGIDDELAIFQAGQDAEQEILDQKLANKEITEKQFKKKSEELEKQSRQKEAKAEKKKALFDIAINTIVGVAKTFATLGWPAGIIPAAGLAAVGAAQAAVVAARPIPKFAKGVRNFEGGDAVVGEEGREFLQRPGHVDVLSPGEATQMFLPQGTNVIPHAKTEQILQENSNEGSNIAVVKGLEQINNSIRNQKKAPVWTDRGLTIRDELKNSSKTYIDKYLR